MKTKFLKLSSVIILAATGFLSAPAIAGGGSTPGNKSPSSSAKMESVPAQASANGKYSGLIQRLYCPQDKAQYGNYNDYGYWSGGDWCGQVGKAGYWVWVSDTWYVWERQQ